MNRPDIDVCDTCSLELDTPESVYQRDYDDADGEAVAWIVCGIVIAIIITVVIYAAVMAGWLTPERF